MQPLKSLVFLWPSKLMNAIVLRQELCCGQVAIWNIVSFYGIIISTRNHNSLIVHSLYLELFMKKEDNSQFSYEFDMIS